MDNFVHLHVHTEYSLLDGACRIDRLLEHAKSMGQDAVAITDHGVMYGAVEFYKKAKKAGIKPIIGCEVYVAPRTMYDRVHKIDSSPFHLVLLCKNETGYKNLIAMVSKASIDGFYTKPRVDMALLAQKSEGLIALSGCLSGQLPRLLASGRYDDAKEAAQRHLEIFGKENYFIEIQNHGIEDQQKVLPLLRKLARELDIGLVATNDCHYITKADSKMQHVLTCIQTNTIVGQSSLEFSTEEFFVKNRLEMARALPGFADALDNTVKIAERCNLDFTFGELKLPSFTAPEGRENKQYFREKCFAGLHGHYGETPPESITARLEYELSIIESMGFVDYFLIVHDFIAFAKSKGIPVGPGRGSGAGSIAAYCIGITGIDPIKYGLIFERFLNPQRISMPDFDIDFCYVRRPEVIEYVVNRYGADHVAQIITFGTMAARAAVKDTGRALGLPYQVVDGIAKKIPFELGITLEKALGGGDFKRVYEEDPQARELIDMAKSLEGMPRHASTHAAGVVITREPVDTYVPLQRGEDAIVTQYTMGTLEELGLLKMDFLGLRNLTVIADAEKLIQQKQPDFSVESIPTDDKKVYTMLGKGATEGVFQFESGGMRQVLMQLRPEHMEDLIAVISLYRPGPMDSIPMYVRNRHNPSLVSYKHKSLANILDVTYGCIVYQEQVMQIFRELAGFSYGRADLVRRAMSKKKHDVMLKERDNFIFGLKKEDGSVECNGCVANGIPEAIAGEIFEEMVSFASYAFNKSHAAAYALVAYQTAYLKRHYPSEYMAALLTSVLDSTDKVVGYSNECERLGIKILPPDVNESEEQFVPTSKGIRFGLLAIKNLGRAIVKSVVTQRQTKSYESFYDLCHRLYAFDLRRRPLESLIKSGALDSLGLARRTMLEGCDTLLNDIDRTNKENLSGQLNLFGDASNNEEQLTPKEEFPRSQLLKMEKEVLGLYVTGHPLDEFKGMIKKLPTVSTADIIAAATIRSAKLHDDARVQMACVVNGCRTMVTKKGETMAYLAIEDLTGTLEALVFPKTYDKYKPLLQEEALLWLGGRLSYREDEEPKLMLESVELLSDMAKGRQAPPSLPKQQSAEKRSGLYLKIPSPADEGWEAAQEILRQFHGDTPVYVYFLQGKTLTLAPKGLWVDNSEELRQALSLLLGESSVAVKE